MTQFKVGDKVRILEVTANDAYHESYKIGKEGILIPRDAPYDMILDDVVIWEDGSIGCAIRFTDKTEIKEATFHSVYLEKIEKKTRKPFGWLSIYVWAISAIAGMFVGAFIGANLILNGYSPNLTAIGVIGLCVLVVSFAISISNINEKDC